MDASGKKVKTPEVLAMPAYMIHPFNPWYAMSSGRQGPLSSCMPLDACPPSSPAIIV